METYISLIFKSMHFMFVEKFVFVLTCNTAK